MGMEIIISDKSILKRLKTCDRLVGVTFVLMVIIKFVTITLFAVLQKATKAQIEHIATTYEANALFKMLLSLDNMGFIIGAFILPASALAYYLYMRRKVLVEKVEIDAMEFFVQFAFFLALLNIVNDGAALFGTIIQYIGG